VRHLCASFWENSELDWSGKEEKQKSEGDSAMLPLTIERRRKGELGSAAALSLREGKAWEPFRKGVGATIARECRGGQREKKTQHRKEGRRKRMRAALENELLLLTNKSGLALGLNSDDFRPAGESIGWKVKINLRMETDGCGIAMHA